MKLSISMTRQERLLGTVFLMASVFVLPSVFSLLNMLLPRPLSATELNIFYFAFHFLCVTLLFRQFLRKSVAAVFAKPLHCLGFAVLGLALYYGVSILVARGIGLVNPDFSNVNDSAIGEMAQTYTALMFIGTVFLVPVYEETLYRGLLFQGLHSKHRGLAYIVSVTVFALIHVMGYVGLYDRLTLLLCFVQYLPAGILLAWAYERTDTVATPIFMHITINLIAMSSLR